MYLETSFSNYQRLPEIDEEKGLWIRYATTALGIWLITCLPSFNIHTSAGAYSDALTGIILIVLGLLSCGEQKNWVNNTLCGVGIWLQIAPVIFQTPNAIAYLNDSLVGIAAISLYLFNCNSLAEHEQGPELPRGWSYNPSTWKKRIPALSLALVAWTMTRYLAAYQLGYITTLWDPFFGDNGSARVITSEISKTFPLSDAALGAVIYTFEILLSCKGGSKRWHTMPWVVTLFTLLAVPCGLVSILLVISQSVILGNWCTWCLLTSIIMLLMIAFSIDEAIASLHFVQEKVRQGNTLWEAFIAKDLKRSERIHERSPTINYRFESILPSMSWGVSMPWNLSLSAVLGIWIMFSPDQLELGTKTSLISHILGSAIAAVSIVSFAELARAVRWANVFLGAAVAGSSWIFSEPLSGLGWLNCFAAIATLVLSVFKGKVYEFYGPYNWLIK